MAIGLYFRCNVLGQAQAAIIGAAAAAAGYWTTRGPESKEVPPDWDCGAGVPVGAVFVALAGFLVACLWIDTVLIQRFPSISLWHVFRHEQGLRRRRGRLCRRLLLPAYCAGSRVLLGSCPVLIICHALQDRVRNDMAVAPAVAGLS